MSLIVVVVIIIVIVVVVVVVVVVICWWCYLFGVHWNNLSFYSLRDNREVKIEIATSVPKKGQLLRLSSP